VFTEDLKVGVNAAYWKGLRRLDALYRRYDEEEQHIRKKK